MQRLFHARPEKGRDSKKTRLNSRKNGGHDKDRCNETKNRRKKRRKTFYPLRGQENSIQKLVESGRYDTQEDFTVVLQPFLRTITLPLLQDGRPDISFFAPDCFHLSQKSHSMFSRALWNNMVEHQPLGHKCFAHVHPHTLLGAITGVVTCHAQDRLYPKMSQHQICFQSLAYSACHTNDNLPPCPFPHGLVHELRPADIQVVAALGDSLTTAVGAQATGLNDVGTAWRGVSWSAGSDGSLEIHTTLPNILKKFNSNLFGASTGTLKENAGFNRAVGGATAQNLSAQARELVDLMKSSSELYSVEKYVKHLQDVLDILYKEDRSTTMINSGHYAQRTDFAVVVQPFFRNTFMPLNNDGKPDLSYFAVDCFHLSEKGHAEMAMALWNNMLEPVGHKQTYNNFMYNRSKLKCPTSEHPYFFTSRNNEGQSSGIGAESSGDVIPYWVAIVAAIVGIVAGSLIVWIWKTQKVSKHPWAGDITTEEKSTTF
ncbi:hypothetical protein lerEdw1_018859 [Lerista edwardsae]|nr:hypothetical protein lerEdw1_018859 [Lerista edwardsae]